MPNDYFRFKQFTVRQNLCAMKVGTDGTLLGAWARGGHRVLDIGCGTGLIALMMAQRFPDATVTAIDIDGDSCRQAAQNVAESPFAGRIAVRHEALQAMPPERFDAIVCNPPFFVSSLPSPDEKRTLARHSDRLPYSDLLHAVGQMLTPDGEFSAILPFDCMERFHQEAVMAGLFASRTCAVSTSERKPPRRHLLAYRLQPPPQVETTAMLIGSPAYRNLMHPFLLHF